MKKLALCLLAGTAFVAATPAFAAAPTGVRVEALAGWDHVSIALDDFGVNDDITSDGIVFGIGAGYDFSIGSSASMGIDIEATESTADFEFDDGVDTVTLSVGRDLYVGGRISFAAGSNANVYVKAGYTNTRFRAEINGVGDSANADGVRGGIGVQFNVGSNAYIGGEYRYSNYEADLSRHQAALIFGFRM